MINEDPVEHRLGGRRSRLRRGRRSVQVATALRAALLRRRASMSAIAKAGRHLQRTSEIERTNESETQTY